MYVCIYMQISCTGSTCVHLFIRDGLYNVASLIDSFLGANNLNNVTRIIRPRYRDLGIENGYEHYNTHTLYRTYFCGSRHLNALQFFSLTTNHKAMMFLWYFQIKVSLHGDEMIDHFTSLTSKQQRLYMKTQVHLHARVYHIQNIQVINMKTCRHYYIV